MAISNGYDETRVMAALLPRKGWTQPTQADFAPVLSAPVTACLSGLPFNHDHNVCSPIALLALQEDEAITDPNFNAYLMSLKTAVIMDALNSVFMKPQIIEEPKQLFDKIMQTQNKPISNNGKFCGWQIRVSKGDYAVKVDSITMMTDTPCNFNLYLFNDFRKAPIWTKPITVTTAYDQTIINVDDCVLNYTGDNNKGGTFYLGYFQDDLAALGAQALDTFLVDIATYNLAAFQAFESNKIPGQLDFVRSQFYGNYKTYGLNLELSTYYDLTNTIVRNASQFDRLIGLKMVARCIEEVMYSTRSNRTQRMTQEQLDMLYTQLEASVPMVGNRIPMAVNVPYKTGIKNAIEREIWRMTQTFNPKDQIVSTVPPVNGYMAFSKPWGGGQR